MDWERCETVIEAPHIRGGWLGVWDAVVAAVTGNERMRLAEPVTFSVWVKKDTGQKFYMTAQVGKSNDV